LQPARDIGGRQLPPFVGRIKWGKNDQAHSCVTSLDLSSGRRWS
jgi:hypothetical protein